MKKLLILLFITAISLSGFANNFNPPCTATVSIMPGDTTICKGSSITLTATGVAVVSYYWSTGDTTSSITVTPIYAANTYTVTITDTNGCIASATVTVSIDNFNVYLPPTMSICANAAAGAAGPGGLYAEITGGVSPFTYTWNTGNTSPFQSLAGLVSGIYSVSVTDANGCAATAVDTLTVHIPPHITITSSANPIEEGDIDTLTASGGIGYSWSTGQTGNQIIVSPRHITGYSVYGWDSNYCGSTINTTIIITHDYWLPSPDTTIPHLKSFPPIYFAGNVSVGRDSAASPHQALEVHGNEIIDTNLTVKGNIKSDSMHVRYFVADSIKTGVINLPDSVLTIGDPAKLTLSNTQILDPGCKTLEFQACAGFLFEGLTANPTTVSIGTNILDRATLDVEGATGGLPGLLVGAGNSLFGAGTNQISAGGILPLANNSIYGESYLGFNATMSGNNIKTMSDGGSNGGTAIVGDVGGGINFFPILNTGGTSGQTISQNTLLVSNNDAFHIGAASNNSPLIGIGTCSPAYSLDVQGTINASGAPGLFWTNSSLPIPLVFPMGSAIRTSNTGSYIGRYLGIAMNDNGSEAGWYWMVEQHSDNSDNACYPMKLTLDQNGYPTLTLSQNGWCDYIFDTNYKIMSIDEKEKYYKTYKHLPGIDSTQTVTNNGLNISKNIKGMLQNLEEDRIDITSLNKLIKEQNTLINQQDAEIKELFKEVQLLKSK